jgi:hypothetical protein
MPIKLNDHVHTNMTSRGQMTEEVIFTFWQGQEISLFPSALGPALEAHLAFHPMGTSSPHPGAKTLHHEAKWLYQCTTAKFKNAWRYNPPPPHIPSWYGTQPV